MTQVSYPTPTDWTARPPARLAAANSGLATAALICSTAGLVTCFAFIPSVVGLALGIASFGQIGRGERSGRGLAYGAILLGLLGIVAGAAVVIAFAGSPADSPIPGRELGAADRAWLEGQGLVAADEVIDLFYSGGILSIKAGGVVLTDRRLVAYGRGGQFDACGLGEICNIRFFPSARWMDDGRFVAETDQHQVITFVVGSAGTGDRIFDEALRKRVSEARAAAGKPGPLHSAQTEPQP